MRFCLSAAAALVIAAAVPPVSAQTHYRISGNPGAVTAIVIAPVAGGRIVADRMLGDSSQVQHEREAFTSATGLDAGSCAYAAEVRPFTRLRRYRADGRLQWEWDLAQSGLALALLGAEEGDCLSPGETRLLVNVFDTRRGQDLAWQDLLIGQGVIAVGPDSHGLVQAEPVRGPAFGNPRTTGPIRWRPGAPATLEYETGANTATPGRARADFTAAPTR